MNSGTSAFITLLLLRQAVELLYLHLFFLILIQIMLEIVGVKDLPVGSKSNLFISFGKKQPDLILNTRKQMRVSSESGEKQVVVFQCEPTGEIVFDLMTSLSFNLPIAKPVKVLGSASISLENLLNPIPTLYVENWFELMPNSGVVGSKPISLRIALSLTAPIPAPYVVQMVQMCPVSKGSCFISLSERSHHANSWTCVMDETDNEVISFLMR